MNRPSVSRAIPPAQTSRSSAFPAEQLVSLTKSRSFEAEQYRTLSQIVESRCKSRGERVLAVSSPGIGDGKTVTTLNLAGALAQSRSSRVLVIDGDLRCPSVASHLRLGGPGRPGLAAAIRGQVSSLQAALSWLPEWNLSVLTAGIVEDSPYELLKSQGFSRLIEEVRRDFDFALIDCPPLLAVPDCRVIERAVDGFLLVVSAGRTPRKLLEEALNVLPAEKVAGIIFNRDARPLSGYYGYYDRHYGGHRPYGKS
ncbi:MAG TPA: CpsD/CapB family tyrosine-protein kinase [Candidatus Polarisedimenticolia bacterium]|nr:CpsD/CapB family tyrosine-protein kinase [Candidatus Polarisedimenticolia bacterium]